MGQEVTAMRVLTKLAVLGLVAAAVAPIPALAAGGGPSTQAAEKLDPDFKAGMDAIKAKQWDRAIASIQVALAREPDNAEMYTELGYAERNRGDLDAAFGAYDKAIALNPRHLGAHEYVGEAYLLTGNLDKAQEQLAALDKLCFITCSEYRDLKHAIADYKTKQAKAQ
jgi:Flp pilus assembly protein TadD